MSGSLNPKVRRSAQVGVLVLVLWSGAASAAPVGAEGEGWFGRVWSWVVSWWGGEGTKAGPECDPNGKPCLPPASSPIQPTP
jgi:hypothetical protein